MSRGQWITYRTSEICPICQHKGGWCGYSSDGQVVCCMRVESNKPVGNGGWIHRVSDVGCATPPKLVARPERVAQKLTTTQLSKLQQGFLGNPRLEELSPLLSVTVDSLLRLGVGHDGQAWTFPMKNYRGFIVGFRRRFKDGTKLTLKNSSNGLFIPRGINPEKPLYLVEGPTDAAALLDLGLDAVGRPSCNSGTQDVLGLLRGSRLDVVIVADNDKPKKRPDGTTFCPGPDGARRLGNQIFRYCKSICIIKPRGHKDIRSWKRAGATKEMIENLVLNTKKVYPQRRKTAKRGISDGQLKPHNGTEGHSISTLARVETGNDLRNLPKQPENFT